MQGAGQGEPAGADRPSWVRLDSRPPGERSAEQGDTALAEIRFEGVTKTYAGGTAALSAIDLTIASRELMVVLGPSGSGKTTLLRLIAGLERPDAGGVWIERREVTSVPPHRRDVAMVFQHPALYPHLSVFDNIAFGLRARGIEQNQVRAQVNTIAGLLGLDRLLRRRPAALSGGERQRVAIGRAIARQPRVLLCDEPFSNLDPPLRVALREEVAELHRRFGSTLVLVTHDQSEALVLGDRIAILDRGRLLQCGTPREVYEHPVHRFVATFVGSPPMNLLPCELVRRGDETRIHLIAADRSLSWAMPSGTGPEEWPESGRVEVGVRPESIAIHQPGMVSSSPLAPIVEAQVRRLEFNGPEVLATLALGPHRLVARLPASLPVHARQHVRVALDLGQAAWFESESGRSLPWRRA
jgi:multiple sugar transport system ATP-binding protein